MKNRRLKKAAAVFTAVFMVLVSAIAGYAETDGSISLAEKGALYDEYVKIARAVSEETLCPVSVLPMEAFGPEDWVSPEEYRMNMEKIANSLKVTVAGQNTEAPAAAGGFGNRAVRTAEVSYDGGSFNITVAGSFDTQYYASVDRQLFGEIRSLKTEKTMGTDAETWADAGYAFSLIDGGRTYSITAAGNVGIGTNIYATVVNVHIYCSAEGQIL